MASHLLGVAGVEPTEGGTDARVQVPRVGPLGQVGARCRRRRAVVRCAVTVRPGTPIVRRTPVSPVPSLGARGTAGLGVTGAVRRPPGAVPLWTSLTADGVLPALGWAAIRPGPGTRGLLAAATGPLATGTPVAPVPTRRPGPSPVARPRAAPLTVAVTERPPVPALPAHSAATVLPRSRRPLTAGPPVPPVARGAPGRGRGTLPVPGAPGRRTGLVAAASGTVGCRSPRAVASAARPIRSRTPVTPVPGTAPCSPTAAVPVVPVVPVVPGPVARTSVRSATPLPGRAGRPPSGATRRSLPVPAATTAPAGDTGRPAARRLRSTAAVAPTRRTAWPVVPAGAALALGAAAPCGSSSGCRHVVVSTSVLRAALARVPRMGCRKHKQTGGRSQGSDPPSGSGCPAASYSPTPSPGQYHRR